MKSFICSLAVIALTTLALAGPAVKRETAPPVSDPYGAIQAEITTLREQAEALYTAGGDAGTLNARIETLSAQLPAPAHGGGSLDQGGDDCANATPIIVLPYCDEGTTYWATDNYTAPCGTSGGRDVVYRYRPMLNQTVTISLCGSYFNTILHVWRYCPSAPGTLICCNDNVSCAPYGTASCCLSVSLTALPTGQYYYIIVDGAGPGQAGHYILNVVQNATSCAEAHCAGTPPPNDLCANAIALANPGGAVWLSGYTIGATVDATPLCNGIDQVAPGVWYKVTGDGTTYTFTTCDQRTDYDTRLSVFCGTCTDLICVTANDNFNIPVCGMTSEVEWCTEAGRDYYILVHGATPIEVGKFWLGYWSDFTACTNPPVCTTTPQNDLCVNAQPVATPAPGSGLSVWGTTLAATWDNAPCCVSPNTAPGVWYSIAGNGNTLTASVCNPYTFGQGWDTKISVYCNSCQDLICVDGNNDDINCAYSGLSTVSWCSVAGETYYILVHGLGLATGNFSLDLSSDAVACAAEYLCYRITPPPNDLCDQAIPLAVPHPGPKSVRGSTNGATVDNAPFCDVLDIGPGVWYKYTGDGHRVTMTTCNELTQCLGYDTRLSVYCGECTDLMCVAGSDDYATCPPMSLVEWCAELGRDYYILVHGPQGIGSDFQLDWWDDNNLCTDPPPCVATGDSCADAITINTLPYCTEGTTWWAVDNYTPSCATMFAGRDRVYKITLTYTEQLTVSLCGSYFNTVLHIWRGCPTAGGTMICCNNDFAGCPVNGLQSCCPNVVFLAYETYYIIVDGNGPAEAGHYILNVVQSPQCPSAHCAGTPPPNDSCEAAILLPNPLSGGQWMAGWTIGATLDGAPACAGEAQVAPGVWYKIIGNGNTMTVTTCDPYTDFDTKLSVYCNECDTLVCITANDNFNIPVCGMTSLVEWCTQPGEEYYILVHGKFAYEVGNFRIGYWHDDTPCSNPPDCEPVPPGNDPCEDAVLLPAPAVTPQSILGSTIFASADGAPLCVVADVAPGVWYKLVGDGTTLTATTCNVYTQSQNYDTRLSVYCNMCDDLICVTGNDDWPNCGVMSEVIWCSEAGREYFILVHGAAGSWGDFELDWWSDGQPCTGQTVCTNAEPDTTVMVECCLGPLQLSGSTIGAGNDCSTRPSQDQIWQLNIGRSCEYSFSLCNSHSTWNSYLYLDRVICAATHVATNDDGCFVIGGLSFIDCIYLPAGVYYLLVEGFAAADAGDYILDIRCCCDDLPSTEEDLGDLPTCNYPTLPGNPSHSLSGIAWLGDMITPEPVPNQLNLDPCDDGITFVNLLPWPACGYQEIIVKVAAGPRYFHYVDSCCGCLWLNAWMDGNLDGDFCDELCGNTASEWIIQDVQVTPGIRTYQFHVPGTPGESISKALLRFRLTSQMVGRYGFGEMNPRACPEMICGTFAHDFLGEVEDYILVSPPQHLVIHPIALGATPEVVTHLQLHWLPVNGAGTYSVYRDLTVSVPLIPANLIGTTADTTFTDTLSGAIGGVPKYFYTVTASNP